MREALASGSVTDAALRRWAADDRSHVLRRLPASGAARWSAEGTHRCVGISVYRRGTQIAFRDPLSVADLAIDGSDLMELGIPAGPAIGETLRRLLDVVIEDPSKNQRDTLLELAGPGGTTT